MNFKTDDVDFINASITKLRPHTINQDPRELAHVLSVLDSFSSGFGAPGFLPTPDPYPESDPTAQK
jgi:hypothetical protein